MTYVYLLWHIHVVADSEDAEKLIGVYATEPDAMAAIERLRDKFGFRDFPEGFRIVKYTVNRDEWREGFISWAEAQKRG